MGGTFKSRGSEEAYLAHIDEIRRLLPKGRLLDFNVKKHGWRELLGFLGTSGPPEGTPFPRPRQKNMRTNEPLFENNLRVSGAASFLAASAHAFIYLILVAAVRACSWLLMPWVGQLGLRGKALVM